MFEHQHYWRSMFRDTVMGDDKRATATITTMQCRCGAMRYDKVDHTGFVSTTVTDANGEEE